MFVKRNPRLSREEELAIKGYEHFHGGKSEWVTTDRIQWPPPDELEAEFGPFGALPEWVSALGELLSFSYEKVDDDTWELHDEEIFEFKNPLPLLCSDYYGEHEGDESLYIVGGKYRAHPEEDLICGNLIWISYQTIKEFDDFQPVEYKHRFSDPWPVIAQSKDRRQFYIFRADSEFSIERKGNVSAGIAG